MAWGHLRHVGKGNKAPRRPKRKEHQQKPHTCKPNRAREKKSLSRISSGARVKKCKKFIKNLMLFGSYSTTLAFFYGEEAKLEGDRQQNCLWE